MKEQTFSQFSQYTQKLESTYIPTQLIALNLIGDYLVDESKGCIGYLQPAKGDFPAWQELADSTIKDKQAKGYDFNADHNPLLRTGELEDSISKSVIPNLLSVGSTSEVMVYMEEGTTKMPARPVLGPTMFAERHKIELALGQFMKSWITGKPQKGIPE